MLCTDTASGITKTAKNVYADASVCHSLAVPRQPKEKIVYRRRLKPVLASRTAAKSGTEPM